ncbi:hypothetical protein B0J14DRAFT_224322 [Halenospora varia]|nr:hypothetical protein B0J14DRAFT_224322 [Halenospora varia]
MSLPGPPAKRRKTNKSTAIAPSTSPTSTDSKITLHSVTRTQSFFVEKLYNVPQRLGLSPRAQRLLLALDEVNDCMIEEVDLGRRLRLTSNLDEILQHLTTQSCNYMTAHPEEQQICVSILSKVAELLRIKDIKPSNPNAFPFLKLPSEIRNKIYTLCLPPTNRTLVRHDFANTKHANPSASCPSGKCPAADGQCGYTVDISLVLTCSRIRDEALPQLYKSRQLSFSCTCVLLRTIRNNAFVRENIRDLRFHWRGEESDAAINQLRRCGELKNLTVRISKMTLYHMSKRAEKMDRYFHEHRTTKVRLSEARGLDELLMLRGLETVSVKMAPAKVAQKMSEDEGWNLDRLLHDECMGTKPEGYEMNVV